MFYLVPQIKASEGRVVVQPLYQHPPSLVRQAVQAEVEAHQRGVAAESPPEIPATLGVDLLGEAPRNGTNVICFRSC